MCSERASSRSQRVRVGRLAGRGLGAARCLRTEGCYNGGAEQLLQLLT